MEPDAYDQLKTTNLALNKVAGVLAYNVRNISLYRRELVERFFPLLVTFGDLTSQTTSKELHFASALPAICRAAKAADALASLIANLLQQLGALCSEQTRKSTVISGPDAGSCLMSVAQGLATLVSLDTIVSKTIASDADLFGAERVQQAQQQQAWLADLKGGLFSGNLFRHFLQQHCSQGKQTSQICGHQAFAQAMSAIIRQQMQVATERIGANAEMLEDRPRLLSLLCLGTVHIHICTPHVGLDKKLVKLLLDLHHKVPLLPVYCHLSIQPASFLSKMLPPAADKYIQGNFIQEALADQKAQVGIRMHSYAAELQKASLVLLAWQAEMAALLNTTRSSEALLTKQAAAAVQGLDLAAGMRNRLQLLLDLHAAAGAPVTQQALSLFVTALCLVKGVSSAFHQHNTAISALLPSVINHSRSVIQGLLTAMAAKVRSKQRHLASTAPSLLQFASTRSATEKALKDAEMAVVAALQAIAGVQHVPELSQHSSSQTLRCQEGRLGDGAARFAMCSECAEHSDVVLLSRSQMTLAFIEIQHHQCEQASVSVQTCHKVSCPSSRSQMVMLDLCRDAINATASISEHRMEALDDALRTLKLLLRLPAAITQASDCSWLYHDRQLLSSALGGIMRKPERAHQITYLLQAFLDAHSLFLQVPTDKDWTAMQQSYDKELYQMVESTVLQPLCDHIEKDLRLQHHAAALVGVTPLNPLTAPMLDWGLLLNTDSLQLATVSVNIRGYVQRKLSVSFTSYATVTPQDWLTYEEMRNLALDKHGLRLDPIELPTETSGQRADCLSAIQDLPSFVCSYSYSQASCMFLQTPSSAAHTGHLSTLTVQDAADAVQRHGQGILEQASRAVHDLLIDRCQQLEAMFLRDDVHAVLQGATAHSQGQGLQRESEQVQNAQQAVELQQAEHTQQAQHRQQVENTQHAQQMQPAQHTQQAQPRQQAQPGQQQSAASPGPGLLSNRELVKHAQAVKSCLQKVQYSEDRDVLSEVIKLATEMGNAVGIAQMLQLGAAQYAESLQQYQDISHVNHPEAHTLAASGSLVALDSAGIQAAMSSKNSLSSCMMQAACAASLAAAESAAEAKEQLSTQRRRLPEQARAFDDGFSVGLVVLMKVLDTLAEFQTLGWWSAAQAGLQRQQQRLRHNQRLSGDTTAPTASTTSSWLHNIFKPGQTEDTTPNSMSNVDTGRTQLQLQYLLKVASEMKLIEHNFEVSCNTINMLC